VPIGRGAVEFNAHRTFSVRGLLDAVSAGFDVEGFSFIDDQGELHEGIELSDEQVAANYGCRWGCGILELRKKT
jgi:hypothetical protein